MCGGRSFLANDAASACSWAGIPAVFLHVVLSPSVALQLHSRLTLCYLPLVVRFEYAPSCSVKGIFIPDIVMAPSGLPLQCYVCSKKPTFSDVSHLLTHVASKGHLSQYYKLKVKASRDASAQVIIDVYDRWYGDWSIEELMSERMASKEQKRRQSSSRSLYTADLLCMKTYTLC